MVNQDISTAQFSDLVVSLPADTSNSHPAFLKPLITVLSRVVDHFESLGAMIYYWHYLSFDMLNHVANSFNLEAVQGKFDDFKNEVQRFRGRTTLAAFSVNETMKRVCPPQFREIITQFEWPETATLQLLEEFRVDYMAHFELRPYSMILGFVEKIEPSHSFSVTWFIPGVVSPLLIGAPPEALIDRYSLVGKVRGEDRGLDVGFESTLPLKNLGVLKVRLLVCITHTSYISYSFRQASGMLLAGTMKCIIIIIVKK